MAWTTPIVDRTINDVLYVQGIINRINANGWDSLSSTEKTWWATGNSTTGLPESPIKGAFNIIDINRINDNCIHLKNLLAQYNYTVNLTPIPSVTTASIPYMDGVIKILRDNVVAVVNGFYKNQHPTITYTNNLDYIMVNNLELSLKLTNDLLLGMISLFPMCGTISCGQSVL